MCGAADRAWRRRERSDEEVKESLCPLLLTLSSGFKPIHFASAHGWGQVVNALVSAGAAVMDGGKGVRC